MKVCVYGSSSKTTPKIFLDAANTLGKLLAKGQHLCINGAGKAGCMGALNDGVLECGGEVRGVILRKWIVDGEEHPAIKDLVVVDGDTLQERKMKLLEGCDCVIVLPGGIGTWDEMWETTVLSSLGMQKVPICVVNVNGYYDDFISMLHRAQKDCMLYTNGSWTDLIHFETSSEAALTWCIEKVSSTPLSKKELSHNQASSTRVIHKKVQENYFLHGCITGCFFGLVFSLLFPFKTFTLAR